MPVTVMFGPFATAEPPCEDGFCGWFYDVTGNESATRAADWFVDRPLQVLITIVVAMILNRVARRAIDRMITRSVERRRGNLFDRVSSGLPGALAAAPDPRRTSRINSLSSVLTSTATVTIWTIAILIVLGTIGVELAPLLAGAGIAGIAIGFGAQELVRDCIAGFFMLVEDQYAVGDVVDLGEATGVVEEITLRVTVLRSIDGTVWHVPNGVVQRVGNKSQLWSIALVDVDVAYDTDLPAARTLLLDAVNEVCARSEFEDQVLEPPTMLGVEALAADGITLRVTTKVVPGAQWNLQRAMREHIKERFDAAGIEIPFPQRTVWMRADDPPGPTAS